MFERESFSAQTERSGDGRGRTDLGVSEGVLGKREFVAFEELGDLGWNGGILDVGLAHDRFFDPIDHIIACGLL